MKADLIPGPAGFFICLEWLWIILWMKVNMMKAVQVVLDEALLQATDTALLRTKQNRSEFVRDALREHLRRLGVLEQEASDRKGYERTPQDLSESRPWENEAVWPAE